MLTAIYVYQSTSLFIETSESDLQLCGMTTGNVPLVSGPNTAWLAHGVYKIVSSHEVKVTGETAAAFESVPTTNKTNGPRPPSLGIEAFGPLDASALQAFFVESDAKAIANP